MNLLHVMIKKPATVYVLVLMILVMGSFSFRQLPREMAPDIQVPILIVAIPFPGASPEDVESLITQKVELEFQGLDKLKSLKSVSAESVLVTTLEFTPDFKVDDARTKVREALDKVRSELPTAAEDPIITEINLSETPMLLINLSGQVGLLQLKDIAEKLKEDIEAIKGILEVRRIGGLEREIRVYVDLEKLRYYNLDLNQVSAAIQRENTSIPGGTLEMGPTKYLIRIPGEFQNPDEIYDLVVAAPNQKQVTIRDLGRVSYGFKELQSRSRLNGLESVSLSVIKRSGENLLDIREKIQTLVANYQQEYQGRIKLSILSDQGKRVVQLNNDMQTHLILGCILVLVMLFIAMGIRSSLQIATSIPLSFLMGLFILEMLGYTLNMVVLFSLILVLGMLVDDAIVVVENIYRHMQAGKTRLDAALDGIAEVWIPVTTSTLTTLVAYLPMLGMPGIVGQFMKYLPATVMVMLSCSLFVALFINPALCATLLKIRGGDHGEDEFALLEKSRLLQVYRRILEFCLRFRGIVLIGVVLLFAGIMMLYGSTTLKRRGVEFFPRGEPAEAVINITASVGTTLAVSDKLVHQIENMVTPYQEHIESIVANVGQARGSQGTGGTTNYLSHIVLAFPSWEHWKVKPSVLMEKMRDQFKNITGAEVKMTEQAMGPPTGPPINIEIKGKEFAVMKDLAETIKRQIKDIPGLVNLTDNFDRSRPEVRVILDREKIAQLGLRTLDIAMTIRTAFNGQKVSTFRDGKEEYDIVVQLDEKFRQTTNDLSSMFIKPLAGTPVPLSELAKIETGPAYGSIRHVKRDRVITVSADAHKVPGPVLLEQVRQRLENLQVPEGYAINFTGEREDLQETQRFLTRSFFIAIFLIFLLLVPQFNSVMAPFVILSTVLLSLMGVFIGVMVRDVPFSVMMGGIGTVSLAGIVVKNGILLIDFMQKMRERGYSLHEAVVLGGMVRVRPVMLTSIATVLGLVPIALALDINFMRWPVVLFEAESATFWKPMAFAIIFGLTISTLLTLIVVPLLYSGVESLKLKLGIGIAPAVPAKE